MGGPPDADRRFARTMGAGGEGDGGGRRYGGSSDDPPLLVGGRYELLGLIGAGGMGTVYRARDRELDDIVALKMLRREVMDAPGILDRFRREVKLGRMVTHPNVARTYDIGEHQGDRFLTMEFVDGQTLSAMIDEGGALPVPQVVAIGRALCAGLAAAHAVAVVHRDLKPDNVIIGRDGRVVITDFGIARDYDSGAPPTQGAVGTPAYMAPEQVEAIEDIDPRADLYALGVMLFELCTGDLPWRGNSSFTIATARLVHPPPDPRTRMTSLPDGVAHVIRKLMARKRRDRYASAEDAAAALAALAVSEGETSAVRATGTEAKTIAVLPFRGPQGEAYLGDGLADDLIDNLSMVRELKVRARGSVMRLRGQDRDPRELGRELDVQVVVDGDVRRHGDLLRISTRLISVSDGFQLWARRFECRPDEILGVGDEAARAIAEALTTEISPQPRAALADPIALDLYLRARHEYYQRGRDHVHRAIELFEQALDRAPDAPMLLSGYAMARARLFYLGGEGAKQSGELAQEAAERAVAAAPQMGEPHVALASVKLHTGEPAGAVRELRRAISAAPGLADAHDMLGRILVEIGSLEEGIRHLRIALTLEPELLQTRWDVVRAYALLGRWDKVDIMLDESILLPDQRGLFLCRLRMALWRGDQAAIEEFARSPLTTGEEFPLVRVLVGIIRDHKLPAETPQLPGVSLETGGEARRRRALFAQLLAEAGALLPDVEKALKPVQASLDAGLIDIAWLDRCPVLAPIRADPRFAPIRAIVADRAKQVIDALTAPHTI